MCYYVALLYVNALPKIRFPDCPICSDWLFRETQSVRNLSEWNEEPIRAHGAKREFIFFRRYQNVLKSKLIEGILIRKVY